MPTNQDRRRSGSLLFALCLALAALHPAAARPRAGADLASSAPRLLAPGTISTRDYERDGAFTPDGRSFYFTKRTIWPYFSAICVSHLVHGAWTEPDVAPFSGQYPDATPFVNADGSRLYFASRRPVEGSDGEPRQEPPRDYDLWVVDRTPQGWGAPRHLPAPVNGPDNQIAPVETRDGSLYFVGAAGHVVRSARQGDTWLAPEPVGDVGKTGETGEAGSIELGAYVDRDERFMVVSVIGRADALHSAEGIYPRADLYIRRREGGVWSPLQHLPAPINSAADELSPSVTPDGRWLLFTSERGRFTEHGARPLSFDELERGLHEAGNGLGDLYEVDARALGLPEIGAAMAPAALAGALPPPAREPRLFGEGVLSTGDDEFGGALTPDGKTLYFTRSAPHSYRYTICESHWRDGSWSTPTVAPFSGQYTDSDPVLSPDGTKLFWTSDRPLPGTGKKAKHDYDIWTVERRPGGGWSAPIHLPAPVNSDSSEFFASMTRGGTLYFSSSRDGGDAGTIQAYRSRFVAGAWTPVENVTRMIDGPETPPAYDLDTQVDPDERFLLISSVGRPDGFGHFDLYIAWRRGDGWSRLVHLPAPFNTRARDYSPHLSPDGRRLFFSSERGFALEPLARPLSYGELVSRLRGTENGSGNLYEVDAAVLETFRVP